ncbi:MAG: protein translocase subunit SecD [Verrucomicrobiota bacterium]|nr:protein translocase subunit SecD [Verrucomicrobiota bacterium]
MDRYAFWKWLILIGLTASSIALVIPWKDRVKYGLDIQGGSSFIVAIEESRIREELRRRATGEMTDEQLENDVRKSLRDAQPRALEVIRNRVDALGTREPLIYAEKGNNRIVVQLPGIKESQRREAEETISRVAFLAFHVVHKRNDELVKKLMDERIALDGFKIVDDKEGKSCYAREIRANKDEGKKVEAVDPMLRFPVGKAPLGHVFLLERVSSAGQGDERFIPICVKHRNEMSGEYVTDARVEISPTGSRDISLEFDSKGGKIFGRVTTDYGPNGEKNRDQVGAQLAIVLDGTVYSAPVIREPIHGGRAQITGHFPGDEAYKLALVLRTGSMPAPVKIVERRHVDPTLGKDSVQSGLRSVAVGGAAVLLFMLLYYRLAGCIANLALILNIVLLPVGLVLTAGFLSLGVAAGTGVKSVGMLPVMTLPGIAGIGLAIGMAVDANILIFERMREEFKTGKRFWSAVTAGYDRAFSAILDSNLTTVLTGIIMFVFGSGPVRGFAVTTTAGILISMYTAIIVTKMMFALVAKNPNIKDVKMLQWLKMTSIDFMSKGKPAILISVAIIAVSWGVMIYRGVRDPAKIFSVDFVSGTSVTCKYDAARAETRPTVAAIRAALEEGGTRGLQIQYQKEIEAGGAEYLHVKANYDESEKSQGEKISRILTEKFPQAGFKVTRQEDVDPLVGAEMTRRAIWAVGIALAGIIVYLWIRFEFGFGVGAVAAVFHDVLITAGLYSLMGLQLSVTMIAALLMIIGYSVNDTIVIYDRIRENLKLIRDKNFVEICNLSVNQTLSRTILTNAATFLTVIALLALGGGAMNELAAPLFIGMLAGTYSTVYIATPVTLAWYRNKRPELGGPKVS